MARYQIVKLSTGSQGAATLSLILGYLEKILKFTRKFGNPDIKDKLDGLSFGKANNFVDDFEGIDAGDIAKFDASPELIDAWDRISNLPSAIRKKVLNLEAASKLDNLVLDPDPFKQKKLLNQIIEGTHQLAETSAIAGDYVLDKFKTGIFEGIEGYENLIKGIKKNNDFNSNKVHEVNQAFRQLDLDSGIDASKKVLGKKNPPPDTPETIFDIDYGVKADSGSPYFFKDAYQFKVKNAAKVQDALSLMNLRKQLLNADSENRILQVSIREGTGNLSDAVGGQDFAFKLSIAKQEIPNFKLVITDHLGNELGTY